MTDQAAIMATTGQIKTMSDGSMRLTIEIQPGQDAKTAFSLFGLPGTPIAIARIEQDAAVQQLRKQAIDSGKGPFGKAYSLLHKVGFFYSPFLHRSLMISDTVEEMRDRGERNEDIVQFVKDTLHGVFGVNSLSEVDPETFRNGMVTRGIVHLLPAGFE